MAQTDRSKYQSEWRARTGYSQKQYAKDSGQRKARIYAGRAYIATFKDVPCMDCGGVFPPECMDFDHVRGTKLRPLAMMCGHSKEKIQAEMAKCDVVCSNCHRIRTKSRLAKV